MNDQLLQAYLAAHAEDVDRYFAPLHTIPEYQQMLADERQQVIARATARED